MLKAVIFDLDGVIADSHPIHEAAWTTLFAEQGFDPEKMNLDFLYAGQPRGEIFRHFLGELAAAGIAMAVGTSAQRRRTLETLDHFRIAERFGAVVTGDDVGATKPAPEIFLRAAELVHAAPTDTVVVEDSPVGVEAARAAKMKCVGYAPAERIDELRRAGADDTILEFPARAAEYFTHIVALDSTSKTSRNPSARIAGHRVKGV